LKNQFASARRIAVGRQRPHQARGAAGHSEAAAVRGDPARPAAGVRLHPGRRQVPDEPDGAAGEEGIGSDGQRLAPRRLSSKNKTLYNYFKQLFAQVTNPPIDPIREAIVMSLNSFIGPKPNLLDINAVNPQMRLEVTQPILDFDDMARLRAIESRTGGKFRTYELDITYPVAWGHEGIEAKLASLCAEAVDAINGGHNVIIITDRRMGRTQVAIPALLALSAVHHHLVREGRRTTAGLVVETGSAREVHHFAVLAGYGAEAVHPYLAWKRWSSCRAPCRAN
jgi:hypothetical protein